MPMKMSHSRSPHYWHPESSANDDLLPAIHCCHPHPTVDERTFDKRVRMKENSIFFSKLIIQLEISYADKT